MEPRNEALAAREKSSLITLALRTYTQVEDYTTARIYDTVAHVTLWIDRRTYQGNLYLKHTGECSFLFRPRSPSYANSLLCYEWRVR